MKRSTICIVDREAQADAIVGKLKKSGFTDNNISVLFPDKGSTRDFAHQKETKLAKGATVGAGGAIGATIVLLTGIGELAILGLGSFIAAGPIMAALSGGAIGAGVGGITGALVGLDIPEYEAKRFEGKVKEGGILISVHSESADETNRAERIFKEEGAHDISSSGEAHADHKAQDVSNTTATRVHTVSPVQDIAAPEITEVEQSAPKKKVDMVPMAEQIKQRAFFIAENRKNTGVAGDEAGDWAQAEGEIQAEATRN